MSSRTGRGEMRERASSERETEVSDCLVSGENGDGY